MLFVVGWVVFSVLDTRSRVGENHENNTLNNFKTDQNYCLQFLRFYKKVNLIESFRNTFVFTLYDLIRASYFI